MFKVDHKTKLTTAAVTPDPQLVTIGLLRSTPASSKIFLILFLSQNIFSGRFNKEIYGTLKLPGA